MNNTQRTRVLKNARQLKTTTGKCGRKAVLESEDFGRIDFEFVPTPEEAFFRALENHGVIRY